MSTKFDEIKIYYYYYIVFTDVYSLFDIKSSSLLNDDCTMIMHILKYSTIIEQLHQKHSAPLLRTYFLMQQVKFTFQDSGIYHHPYLIEIT